MANLLPAAKAAEQLQVAAKDLSDKAYRIQLQLAKGATEPTKDALKDWKAAYSKLSSAQWELEQVLGA